MTNTKSTKRALLASVMALLLCFTMLLGTTFAWFTDSVTSGSNVIQSGTLDIDLVDAAGNSKAGEIINFVTADGRAQEAILWEPGCTYKTEPVCVVNKGSLALKYQIIINGIEGDAKLLEAIEWTVTVNGETYTLADLNGHLLPGENSGALVLSGHMKETAGNEYQNLKAEGISISVIATQYTAENDSFDNQYDADATYPEVTAVSNAADLADALAAGGNVVLTADIALTEGVTVPAGADVTLDLNGKTLSYTNNVAAASSAITNKGTLTITNGTVTYEGTGDATNGYATNTITNSGNLTIDGATIINTTTAGASYAIDNAPGSKLVVNSGNIKSYKTAIRVQYGTDVTINGGTVTSQNGYAVQIHLLGSGSATNLTINGGTFTSDRTDDKMALYSYAYGNNTFAGTTVTITGGTFNGDVCFGGGNKTATETVTITGGTFDGELGRYANTGWEDIAKPQ